MSEIVEGDAVELVEAIEDVRNLPVPHQPQPVSLFRTDDPVLIVQRATATATTLATVLRAQKLTVAIQGGEHVKVEGWTLLGSMLGVFPVCVWTRRTEHEEGWEARVEARTLDGSVVGAAEAECLRSEKMWSHTPKNRYGKDLEPRDDHALRSMAQTRATSKALRQPLGFVVSLAGFEATPAEEMPRDQPPEQRVEGPKPLAPPKSWAKLTEMVAAYDQQTHDTFFAFADSARRYLFPDSESTAKLAKADKDVLFQKCAGAALDLREKFDPNTVPPLNAEDVRVAFARVMDGVDERLWSSAWMELAIPGEDE